MKINKNKIWGWVIAIALILFWVGFVGLLISHYNKRVKLRETKLELQMYTDTLTSYRNKNNEFVSRIGVLQDRDTKYFLKLHTKDSIILKLQDQVTRYKKQIKSGVVVAVIETETAIDTFLILVPSEAVPGTSSFTFKDKWIDMSGETKKDTLGFKLKIKNDYTFIFGKEKGVPFVELTNHNPYTETKTMRAFNVDPAKKTGRFGLQLQTGIGYTGKIQPYIGVGVGYTIWRF